MCTQLCIRKSRIFTDSETQSVSWGKEESSVSKVAEMIRKMRYEKRPLDLRKDIDNFGENTKSYQKWIQNAFWVIM